MNGSVPTERGPDVWVVDVDPASVDAGRNRVMRSISRAEKGGKLTASEAEAALARIQFSHDMSSLADCQVVVEAVVEAEAVKVAVFEALDKIVEDSDAVLASLRRFPL